MVRIRIRDEWVTTCRRHNNRGCLRGLCYFSCFAATIMRRVYFSLFESKTPLLVMGDRDKGEPGTEWPPQTRWISVKEGVLLDQDNCETVIL